MLNNDLELKKILAETLCEDLDLSQYANAYKTVTFTENSDGSFLLDSPYCVRVDREVSL